MSQEPLHPVIDMDKLQQKANEYAQKGAEESIKEFYTGYNSPYKKAIEQNLLNKGVDRNIEIPDIIAILNDGISKEIDSIANTAIAKTFLPLVKSFLTRAESELKLSDILEEFIECTGYKNDEDLHMETYTLDIVNSGESFKYLTVSTGKISYKFGCYFKDSENKNVAEVFTIPDIVNKRNGYSEYSIPTMKVSLDGVTLEMPFKRDILSDKFVSYIAKLVIANSKITFDVDDFNDDMFPKEECHCD